MTRKVVLEVKNLSKNFGGIKANDNINFKLYEKEIVAIVGDNGAGKSTLIKLLSGIYQKDGGEIYINGDEAVINDVSSAREYGIETVYQEEVLIQRFNATSNLFLGREIHKNSVYGKLFKFMNFKKMKTETKNILKRIGIELENIDSPTKKYSGGQRRAIEVGRAVYWGGEIIIFDEPSNGLGVEQQEKVLNIIRNLRAEFGVSVLLISHNLENVFDLVDRIIVLRNGKKVGDKIKKDTKKEEIVSLITGAK